GAIKARSCTPAARSTRPSTATGRCPGWSVSCTPICPSVFLLRGEKEKKLAVLWKPRSSGVGEVSTAGNRFRGKQLRRGTRRNDALPATSNHPERDGFSTTPSLSELPEPKEERAKRAKSFTGRPASL